VGPKYNPQEQLELQGPRADKASVQEIIATQLIKADESTQALSRSSAPAEAPTQ
jgi:hypothetical protein